MAKITERHLLTEALQRVLFAPGREFSEVYGHLWLMLSLRTCANKTINSTGEQESIKGAILLALLGMVEAGMEPKPADVSAALTDPSFHCILVDFVV